MLTAHHAAEGCTRIVVVKEGRAVAARVVALAPSVDLAPVPKTMGLAAVFPRNVTATVCACDLVRPILASGAAPDAASARPGTSLDYRGPDKAPPSWRQFAKLVQYRFETWIGADEEIANRLRAYLIDRAGKEDEPPPTLAVRAWLNPDGTVERVSFDALGINAPRDIAFKVIAA